MRTRKPVGYKLPSQINPKNSRLSARMRSKNMFEFVLFMFAVGYSHEWREQEIELLLNRGFISDDDC